MPVVTDIGPESPGPRGVQVGIEHFHRRVIRSHDVSGEHAPQSGLSVREFCDWQSLSDPSFYAWRRKLADRDAERRREVETIPTVVTAADQFLPVRVVPDDQVGFGTVPSIEVQLPSGVQLRVPAGFNCQTLADVLAVLEKPPC